MNEFERGILVIIAVGCFFSVAYLLLAVAIAPPKVPSPPNSLLMLPAIYLSVICVAGCMCVAAAFRR